MTPYKYDTIVEWSATIMLMMCVAFTSLNWYPANIITGLIGNIGWMYMGLVWKKLSMFTISTILAAMYVGGVIFYFYT